MVRRKKKKTKTRRIALKPAAPKRKKRKAGGRTRRLKAVSLSVFAALVIVSLLVSVGIGFSFLDRYVKANALVSGKIGRLEMVGVPDWLNERLKEKIYAAATGDGEDLTLDEDAAQSVWDNLARDVAWLDNIKVQTTPESIRVSALWRKPLALVTFGLWKFYIDAQLVVLDYVPISSLPIVEVTGLPRVPQNPVPGTAWQRDDLAAAIAVLDRLDRMDKLVSPDKPLLQEIDSIDVSNFEGRQSLRAPHIRLYTKDNTEIIWGAECGRWQRHLEATDEQKLARLYSYYKEYGSLQGGAKYISLRDPGEPIPLPVDKY
ncbi:MAG: hypothetical protein ACYS76_10110 [Planctomycetota bacterium]